MLVEEDLMSKTVRLLKITFISDVGVSPYIEITPPSFSFNLMLLNVFPSNV